MKIHVKALVSLSLSCVLGLGSVSGAEAVASSNSMVEKSEAVVVLDNMNSVLESEVGLMDDQISSSPIAVEQFLMVIDRIPESVLLEGDQATADWLSRNKNEFTPSSQGETGRVAIQRNWFACVGAIAGLVATTAIPAAKILKIKRYMKSLGGTMEAIKILWGASFSHEKLKALGGAAAALGAELLGIASVQAACK